jgi:hypothetical protein
MVCHFGNRQGMSHDCLNSQSSHPQTETPGDQSNQSESDGKLPQPSLKLRRPGITPEWADCNSAITSLGDSIKEGLSCLSSSFGTESGGGRNMERLLALHTELLQENNAQTAELLKLANAAFNFLSTNKMIVTDMKNKNDAIHRKP